MKVMGGHILKRALSVIGFEYLPLLSFQSYTTNSAGLDQSVYKQTCTIKAQVQPVSRSQIQYLGLEFEKNYLTIYTESTMLNDIKRDTAPDRVIYGGQTFEILNSTQWNKPQGFQGAMGVQVTI